MGFNDDPTDVISPQIMIATTIIPKVMSSLSIIGSLLMIHDIYNKHKRQKVNCNNNNNTGSGRKLTDHHLPMTAKCVVNMCITDIGSSFWSHLLGTWMMPTYITTWPYTVGNDATCSTQAVFMTIFVYASALEDDTF